MAWAPQQIACLTPGEDARVLDMAVVGHDALDRRDIGGDRDSRRRILFLNSPDHPAQKPATAVKRYVWLGDGN
jgi:hypothetical protein